MRKANDVAGTAWDVRRSSILTPVMMDDVAIGPARVGEAEQILKLQYLCYQSEAALYDDWTIPPLTQTSGSY